MNVGHLGGDAGVQMNFFGQRFGPALRYKGPGAQMPAIVMSGRRIGVHTPRLNAFSDKGDLFGRSGRIDQHRPGREQNPGLFQTTGILIMTGRIDGFESPGENTIP